jgi:hypothetical protein
MYEKKSNRLKVFNEKLVRIFRKIDKKSLGYITKYQIAHNFPREEREEVLKMKLIHCLSECSSASHYLDLYGFLELVHVLLTTGLHTL